MQKSHLMTCHYSDLGSAFDWLKQISLAAQPIRSTFLMCTVTRHQCGISAIVPQTSFRGKTSEGVGKCRLFSEATCPKKLVASLIASQAEHLSRARMVNESTVK